MELPARAAYHRHMPGTIMNQQVGDQSPALLVIGADRWDALAEITVEPHDGPTDRSPVIRSVLGVRRHHDAIHHMPAEHVDVLGLASTESAVEHSMVRSPRSDSSRCRPAANVAKNGWRMVGTMTPTVLVRS